MKKRIEVCRSGSKNARQSGVQHIPCGFVGGEKSFDPHFLESNILRRPEGGNRRKQAQPFVSPLVIDGHERWRCAI
jgi:hypothetical protein